MVTVFHGNDIAESRSNLDKYLRSLNSELIFMDGKKISMPEIILVTGTRSLLSERKAVIIENFFRGAAKKEKNEILDYLFKKDLSSEIVFWENRKIEKARIQRLTGKVNLQKFEYPQILFKFLDSIGRMDPAWLLASFNTVLKEREAEIVFAMIIRQFRLMIIARTDNAYPPEIPLWQFAKFQKQAAAFSAAKLLFLYRRLLSIDYQVKTGQTPYTLRQLLDIFIATL
ncbi:hypothetical protein A3B48_02415 [Candidatus Gottesmanbacteria bacterium RIFCSPLOWO2_01_FULL_40_10]|nr:MAG: hypothetical protein A3B48_02415 [Candidatus Gottesmanbacteria bacterium RIFCSPLOWO2_01_FULL_40_10]